MKKMNYKKQTNTFFIYTIFLYSLIYIFVNLFIDPYYEIVQDRSAYNRKHSESIYSTNMLLDKLNKGKYNLVFGTSRSHKIGSATFSGKKILNFHALYGNTESILNLLKSLDKKQIENIESIYMLIDFHTFNEKSRHDDILYSNFSNYFYSVINLDYYKFYISVVYMIKNLFEYPFKHYINDFGVLLNDSYSYKYRLPESVKYMAFDEKYLDKLRQIVDFTENNGKTIIFFTPTITQKRYIEMQKYKDLICDTRKAVLSITNKVYDLTLVDSVSGDTKYFSDPDHLSSDGVSIVLKSMESGYGKVTSSKDLFFCKSYY